MSSTRSIYFSERWKEAQILCQKRLNPNEYQLLEDTMDYEAFQQSLIDIRQRLGHDSRSAFLDRSSMDSLRTFLTLLAVSSGSPPIKTAIIWGILTLVIKAIADFKTIMPETMAMINGLGHDLQILQIYGGSSIKNPEMTEDLINIFVDVILFWTQLLHFLRRNFKESTVLHRWPNIKKDFEDASKKIRTRTKEMKEKFEALKSTQLEEKVENLTTQQTAQSAVFLAEMDGLKGGLKAVVSTALQSNESTLTTSMKNSGFPVHNIPYPKNPHFLSRQEELKEIRNRLSRSDSQDSFKSFALWGAGGIGKTQTALAYAHEQVENGIDAVLWIHCETGLSIARSFAEVATMLKIEGFSETNGEDRNRFLTLQWLRKTSVSWLMILDNVEENKLARACWPIATRGSVLVTSRRGIFSVDPASAGLEIDHFGDKEGAAILLHFVNRPHYSDRETEAARKLSIELGGLGLALAIMAAQIVRRMKTIEDFLKFYKKHSVRLHKERPGIGTYYEGSLHTCWETTFDTLSPEAHKILAIVAFMGPDEIPEAVFQPSSHEHQEDPLPDMLHFCHDELTFEDALSELASTSLIRRNPVTRNLSIHRLIQSEFRNHLTLSALYETFLSLTKLLHSGFPKHFNGLSLRNEWSACQAYVQHVLVLCARWQDYRFKPSKPEDFDAFTQLLASCGWYLMESGSWSEEVELMDTALTVCEDKDSLIYAHLCNSYGCMESERSHVGVAIPLMLKSLEIRQKLLPADHFELANSYNNYGNTIMQGFLTPDAFQQASDLHQKSMDIFLTKSQAEKDEIMYIPMFSGSRSARLLGDYAKALRLAEGSREYVLKKFGANTFFDALADVHIGDVWYDQGKIEESKPFFTRAFRIFSDFNETHPATSSTHFRLACIELHDGRVDKAIGMLKSVLAVAKLCEKAKGDKGETARVTRKLADAIRMKGNEKEAAALQLAAETIRLDIQKDRVPQLPDESRSYDILVWNEYW